MNNDATVLEMVHTPPTRLEKVLGIFASVQAREGVTSLLLLCNIFLILMAYYFIKPVREGWLSISVVSDWSKLEIKSYSAFGQSMLLLIILPVYAWLAASVSRRRLITVTAGISAILLVAFWLMQPGLLTEQIRYVGIAFYIFVGIFSVTLVAQFWSFASDLYGQEKGRRLFPLVAIGASAGGVVGSWVGERAVELHWLNAFDLILLALIPLGLAVTLARHIDRRGTLGHPNGETEIRRLQPAAPDGHGAFRTIYESQYLTITAGMMLLFNWVVSSGDNILFGLVQQALEGDLNGTGDPQALAAAMNVATTAFYSELYFWVNLSGLLLQAFVVSRLVRLGGFGLLLIATPLVSLAAYLSMAIAPVIGIIKVMKVAENSSNYSINNTARHMLWLPTTKAMMYQAKATIDTLFVRIGDGLAALTVLLGTRFWSYTLSDFLLVNIVLSTFWIILAVCLIREYNQRSRMLAQPA
jgi:AAA family ATP:ADP antiporter